MVMCVKDRGWMGDMILLTCLSGRECMHVVPSSGNWLSLIHGGGGGAPDTSHPACSKKHYSTFGTLP